MKTITKELQINDLQITRDRSMCFGGIGIRTEPYKYSFNSYECIDFNTMKVTYEEQEPETLKEFKEDNNLSSKQLTEWLNKNYK